MFFNYDEYMKVKCPTPGCSGDAIADKSYADLLQLADVGQLDFYCRQCETVYKPEPAEQREYAAKLRKMI